MAGRLGTAIARRIRILCTADDAKRDALAQVVEISIAGRRPARAEGADRRARHDDKPVRKHAAHYGLAPETERLLPPESRIGDESRELPS